VSPFATVNICGVSINYHQTKLTAAYYLSFHIRITYDPPTYLKFSYIQWKVPSTVPGHTFMDTVKLHNLHMANTLLNLYTCLTFTLTTFLDVMPWFYAYFITFCLTENWPLLCISLNKYKHLPLISFIPDMYLQHTHSALSLTSIYLTSWSSD
jgi:hypothetical protein